MMEEEKTFDFTKVPGKKVKDTLAINDGKPLISIITAYYNCGAFIEETANSLWNQNFPYWEWIIVNDGSTEKGAKELLESLAKKDKRIKVYHKENEGLPKTRDYAIARSSCDLLYILDPDDVMDPTYLECCYWALKTNPEAGWVYSDHVGFGNFQYLWNKKFNIKKELKENIICGNAVVRKDIVLEVGGYSLAQKGVYEDWHLWLRLLAKGYRPMQMSYYGFWYRRRDGVLKNINKDKKRKKNAMKVIKGLTKDVKKKVIGINLPHTDEYHYNSYPKEFDWNRKPINKKGEKKHLLFILPWFVVGGADKFNYDLISSLDKNKYEITIVTTEISKYIGRQKMEDYAEIFDLNTFLKKEDWAGFIHYLIKSRNIDLVFTSNSLYGYYAIPWLKTKFPNIPFVDYLHAEDFTWRDGGFPRDSIAVEEYLDKTYTCTAHLEELLYEPMNKNKKNTKTVYIGVDTDHFDPKKNYQTDFDLSLYQDKKIILYICRIYELKRPVFMLRVMKKIMEKRNDVVCFVIGDGPELEEIKGLVKQWHLENNIVFFGMQKDVRPFYQIGDVTLICSLTEGLTITAYESLAMGVPVVSADVGGQKELISEQCGKIIPGYQTLQDGLFNREYSEEEINEYVFAILNIIDQKNKDKMKLEIRSIMEEKFTISKMVENLDKEFTKLIRSGSKVNPEICKNESLASNYLILFNELNRRYIDYDTDIDTPKKWLKYQLSRVRDRLWKSKAYRCFVRVCQKTGIVSIKKKIFR